MTVSDWGSSVSPHGAPRVAPGLIQGRSPARQGQYIHPAHGGADPRTAHQTHAQATDPGGFGGYGATPAYGGAQPDADQIPPTARPDLGGMLNILGAVISVVLVVGLGVWGYKLAVRDVTGVPVVRALEGPMRIQPEDPGGVVAPHQGLAVNDVAADGVSAGLVDQLVLAPPATALAPDDVPARPEPDVTAAPGRPATAPPMPATGGEIDADAAVAEALGLSDIPGIDMPARTNVTAPLEVIPQTVPGVSRSPRPMPRPSAFQDLPEITAPVRALDVSASAATPAPARPVQATETAPATAPAVVLGQEVDPGALDAAARLVQLGAYQSPEAARERWTEFAALNPELFQNRNWTIEQGESGGAPFYRLRAIGFDGLADARSFCAALVAAQGSCVPVLD